METPIKHTVIDLAEATTQNPRPWTIAATTPMTALILFPLQSLSGRSSQPQRSENHRPRLLAGEGHLLVFGGNAHGLRPT